MIIDIAPTTYQLLPELSADEYEALKSDIAQRGVQVPVEYDEAGAVLDGHHRLRACQELGIEDWPRIVRVGLSEEGKAEHVLALNLHRRHLTREQRRELVAKLRAQGWSMRRIAERVGVSLGTVAGDSEVFNFEHLPATVTGKDGKAYPAVRHLDEAEILRAANEIRTERREERREERLQNIIANAKAAPALEMPQRYPVVYADPPWRYEFAESESRAIENQYPTMALSDICALPVAELTTEDAILFLWATSPKLAEAMQVITSWGFTYRSSAVWVKKELGMGYYFRQQHEFLLVATRGSMPAPPPDTRPRSVYEASRGKHSEKPAMFYEFIEKMYPTLPKIELFARARREGWESWGNDLDTQLSD